MIENVCNELKKYFEGKPIISALLGFDMIFLYGYAALMVLQLFLGLGGFINALLFYVLVLAILLCFANRNFNALMIGLGVLAILNLIQFFMVISFMFSWGSLFDTFVYGFFAYMAYKKSLAR